MTKITVTQENGFCRFLCKGHAQYAEKGKDIVCAGISALCISLTERIKQLERENVCNIIEFLLSDGEVRIVFSLNEQSKECLETVRAGFQFIAREYSDYCIFNCSVIK